MPCKHHKESVIIMEQRPGQGVNFESEFRRLGENLKKRFLAAWESPTSNELQDEIKSGFELLGDTVTEIISGIAESPGGQKLREEVENFGGRLQSGEVEAKVREELLDILDTINTELEKVGSRRPAREQDDEEIQA